MWILNRANTPRVAAREATQSNTSCSAYSPRALRERMGGGVCLCVCVCDVERLY